MEIYPVLHLHRRYNPCPHYRILQANYIFGSDLDFYEKFTIYLSDEEQERFFVNNPDFMCEFPAKCDKMYLLKDRMFGGILRKIKKCEGK